LEPLLDFFERVDTAGAGAEVVAETVWTDVVAGAVQDSGARTTRTGPAMGTAGAVAEAAPLSLYMLYLIPLSMSSIWKGLQLDTTGATSTLIRRYAVCPSAILTGDARAKVTVPESSFAPSSVAKSMSFERSSRPSPPSARILTVLREEGVYSVPDLSVTYFTSAVPPLEVSARCSTDHGPVPMPTTVEPNQTEVGATSSVPVGATVAMNLVGERLTAEGPDNVVDWAMPSEGDIAKSAVRTRITRFSLIFVLLSGASHRYTPTFLWRQHWNRKKNGE
jgi:hypothetical protein